MTYSKALSYIHSRLKFGIHPGLERIKALLERLGNPHEKLKFIHVAGTNGKGSVCAMISESVSCAGYKTGLFMSPYIVDFCERIQIDGQPIPQTELAELTRRFAVILDELEKKDICVTEFELLTAMAFQYFYEKECDIAVVETGLGGLLDSTNVINPLISTLTSISFDHMDILGNSLEEIALQKAGIIKNKSVTVSYPEQPLDALAVIMRKSAQEDSLLLIPSMSGVKILHQDIFGSEIEYDGIKIKIAMCGQGQVANALTAIQTCRALNEKGFKIDDDHIARGIARVRLPARIQPLNKKPLIILDGSHNPGGIKALKSALESYISAENIIVIMGIMRDKEYDVMLKEIASAADVFIAVTPNNERALDAGALAAMAEKYCENSLSFDDVPRAVREALNMAGENDAIIICGSLYLAGEVLSARIEGLIDNELSIK